MNRSTLLRVGVACCVLSLLLTGPPATAQRQRGGRLDVEPARFETHLHRGWVCAADHAEALHQGVALMDPVGNGQPAFFDQVPRVLFPTYTGPVRFDRFVVVGDHATVQFRLWDPSAPQGFRVETWNRVRTEILGGKTVSIFNPSWPNEEFERIFGLQRWGWDRPMLFWGWFVVPRQQEGGGQGGTSEEETRIVFLKIRPLGIPRSEVRRISDTVQYTSHVANVVIPGFGETRLTRDSLDFDETTVARAFFESFRDVYEGLAILPRTNHLGDFGAFHFNTRNLVAGIGKNRFDNNALFGSNGALQGIEVYPNMRFASNETSSHEIAHQWASNFDWRSIAGIARAGHQPGSHAPLWTGGETLVGAVLEGTVRAGPMPAESASTSDWRIVRAPVPLRFHPMTLYSMGVLAPGEVPPFLLFRSQGQFDPDTSTEPDPGTPIQGDTVETTVDDVIGFHGPRVGPPTPRVWERATIVVSRDGLLSQAELNYYSFFAERIADPARTGVVSLDGYPSFDASTFRRIDMQTRIQPRLEGFETLGQARPVSFPPFAPRDTRVLQFDTTTPSRWFTGQGRTLTGRVVATDRSDFNRVLLRFWKFGGGTEEAVRFEAEVGADGRFSIPVAFDGSQTGRYTFEVFLFWPDSGPQFPRARLSPVFVHAPPAPPADPAS